MFSAIDMTPVHKLQVLQLSQLCSPGETSVRLQDKAEYGRPQVPSHAKTMEKLNRS